MSQDVDSMDASDPDINDVYQIFIADGDGVPREFPAVVQDNIASIKRCLPGARHSMLSGSDVRSLIESHFGADVIAAYDTLSPYAFKADLARYCLLLVKGGLYVDLSVRFVNGLRKPPEKKLAAFRDRGIETGAPWSVQCSIIYAVAGRPELKIALDMVVENCGREYYGPNPLCPSGPVLFGRALALANNVEDYWMGEVRCLTPEAVNPNSCFLTPDKTLAAISVKSKAGDLSHLGLAGTNDYNELWNRKQVYGEKEPTWTASDPQIRTQVGHRSAASIRFTQGMRGMGMFGPYVALSAGTYEAVLQFGPGTVLGSSKLDVTSEQAANLLMEYRADDLVLSSGGELKVGFRIDRAVENVEVRLRLEGDCVGSFHSLKIVKQ